MGGSDRPRQARRVGGADEPLFGQQVPTYNGQEGGIKVQVVTTDEAPIAVPAATSVPIVSVPAAPKPPREHVPRSVQDTGMDSGFDCLLCGDVKVQRIRPGSNVFVSLCGDVYMDLRDTEYPPGSTFNIFVVRLCGNGRMIVPRGTQVTARRLLLCGNRDIYVRDLDEEEYDSAPPSIKVNVLMLCGDFMVRSDEEDM